MRQWMLVIIGFVGSLSIAEPAVNPAFAPNPSVSATAEHKGDAGKASAEATATVDATSRASLPSGAPSNPNQPKPGPCDVTPTK